MQSLSSKELPDNSCSASASHADLHDTDSCSSSVNYANENSHSHDGDDDSTLDSEETQDGATDDLEQDNDTMGFWLSSASLLSSVSGLTVASPLTLEASSSSLNVSVLWGPKSSCDSSQTSIDRVSRRVPRRWTLDSSRDFDTKNRDSMLDLSMVEEEESPKTVRSILPLGQGRHLMKSDAQVFSRRRTFGIVEDYLG
jgi:hypothetical protein